MCRLFVDCVYRLLNVSVGFCYPSPLSLPLHPDACRKCILFVECVCCLWTLFIACGVCLLLVKCFDWICVNPPCLPCVCILMLEESVYCFWNVYCLWTAFIACGMCLLLVKCFGWIFVNPPRLACACVRMLLECVYCLWNVFIACGMYYKRI